MKSRLARLGGVFLLLSLGLYVAREPILFALGNVMVASEVPQKADAVLVIGGDYSGHRIREGARLVRDGYAPVALVSGAGQQYGIHESRRAVDYAVREGYPRESFVELTYPAFSTVDEAEFDIAEMRRRGIKRYILVTSFSHTWRAGRVFRRMAPDLTVYVVGVPQPFWNNGRWWTEREGRKVWMFEALKIIGDFAGL